LAVSATKKILNFSRKIYFWISISHFLHICIKVFLDFAIRGSGETRGWTRPWSSRAERGTPRSYVKPRDCAARRVHLFSPCARALDARDSHTSVRAGAAEAVRQARAAVRALAPLARSLARSRDRRCQLAFSNNFHPSKEARRGRSLRFFSTFLCSFPRALSLSRDPILRRGGLASSNEDEKDQRRHGRSGFARERLCYELYIFFS